MGRYTADVLKLTGAVGLPSPLQADWPNTRLFWGTDVNAYLLKVDDDLSLTYAGNPNGYVASTYIGRKVFDTVRNKIWSCTTIGVAAAAVWTDTHKTEAVNIKDLGAIGDGASHPLSTQGFGTLGAAQAVYPHATSLTNEIDWAALQLAANNTAAKEIIVPPGTYMINRPLNITRDGIKWTGFSHGNYDGGSVIKRNADIKGITATGISITVQTTPFALISRISWDGILFDGGDNFMGGDPANGNAHYFEPMMDIKACYRWAWNNCHFTNCAGPWLKTAELWDSRFMNVEWTFGGNLAGTLPGMWLLSDSYTPGYETSNNLYFFGNRWESSPGVLTAIEGNNGVDFWFHACKWEAVNYQNDYLIRMVATSGVRFTDCWLWSTADVYNGAAWSDASTSNAIAATGTKSFTIASGLVKDNADPYANDIFTGMHVVVYSLVNPDNFMMGRVSSYTTGSGAISIVVEYSEGSGTFTSWKIAPCHPGLVGMSGNCRMISGNFSGGYNNSANPPVDGAFIKTMIDIKNDGSELIDLNLHILGGPDRMPKASFQAYHDTVTSIAVGRGVKNFVIETGKTITAGDMLYFFGAAVAAHQNWMIGRVVSYNTGNGALQVMVDTVSFSGGGSITGWRIMKSPQSMVNQGIAIPSVGLNRVRFTGGGPAYAFAFGTDVSQSPTEFETMRLQSHNSCTLYQRNKTTQEDWYMGRVINDPTLVPDPDNLPNGTITANTGQYQLAVYDFMRGTEYIIWHVDGARNFAMRRPMVMLNSLMWIDADLSGGYKQARFVGAVHSAPPAVSGYLYFQGDIALNTVTTAGSPLGWSCITGGVAGAAVWKPFGTVDHDAAPIGYTGQKYFTQATLTDGATINWNLNTQQAAKVALGGDRTLANPTNMAAGAMYSLIIEQDGTGTRLLEYGSAYKWVNGTAPVLSTDPDSTDVIMFLCDGTFMLGMVYKNFQELAGGPSMDRTAASNGNFQPYTYFNASVNRFYNMRKKRTLAENADWEDPILHWANWIAASTSMDTAVPGLVIRLGLKYAGTIYPCTWSSAIEKYVAPGTSAACDTMTSVPTMTGGSEVEICMRMALPLLFDGQSANFTVGQVVTGTTSGATGLIVAQTDAGATGSLVLTGETGTFVDNEAITDPLGGAAVVNMFAYSYQKFISTVGTFSGWNEGVKATNNSSIDWSDTDPVTYPSFTPTFSGGNINGGTQVSPGTGWTTAPSLLAWQNQPDGTIAYKVVGYGNPSGGGIASVGISDGTPPAGVTWGVGGTTVHLVFIGGNGFGSISLIPDVALLTATPTVPVNSLRLCGDSITRGWSSTDALGDLKHNFGMYERAINCRIPTINMSTAGTAAGNQAQFATTFALQYGLYDGVCNHSLITLGSNDLAFGGNLGALTTSINAIAAHMRSFGELVAVGTLLPRGVPMTITGATKANPCVITAVNTLTNGNTVKIASVGGMTQLNGNTYTVANRTGTTFELSGINSTAYGTYTSGGTASCYDNASAQIPEAEFDTGEDVDDFNADVLDNTIVSDWGPINGRAVFQHGSIATAWKISPLYLSLDFTHPAEVGLAYAGADATLQAQFDELE